MASVFQPLISLEVNQTVDSAVELIKRSRYSRIPIFKSTMDNIVGILYAKDLLIKANTNEGTVSLKVGKKIKKGKL